MASCNTDILSCADNSYGVFDALREESERGRLLVTIAKGKTSSLMTSLFDLEVTTLSDGLATYTYRLKKPIGVRTDKLGPNGEVYWKEQIVSHPVAKIAILGTAAGTLKVDSIGNLLGANTGSRLHVYSVADKTIKTVDIASVSGNTITLKAGQTITTAVGDKVYRGAYGVANSCTVKPSNQYTLTTADQKHTYIRRIWVTYSFEIEDFNVDKAAYSNGMTPQDYLDALMEAGDKGVMHEFVEAFFFDENVKAGDTKADGTTATYAETMGVIPAIQQAEDDTNAVLVKDFADCADDSAKKVKEFINEIASAIDSGMYNDSKKITIMVNKAQERALIELNPIIATYRGVQVFDNGLSDQYNYSVFTIKYGTFLVDFSHEEFLDRYETPVYLMMPSDGIVFFQKPYAGFETVNDKAKLVASNTLLSQGVPNFKFIDRTEIEGNGTGECAIYRAFMDFAIVLKGICSGAYRIGINFQDSEDICNQCESVGGAKILNG